MFDFFGGESLVVLVIVVKQLPSTARGFARVHDSQVYIVAVKEVSRETQSDKKLIGPRQSLSQRCHISTESDLTILVNITNTNSKFDCFLRFTTKEYIDCATLHIFGLVRRNMRTRHLG